MPNYVYYTMGIHGADEDIKAFLDKHVIDGDFDFNTFIPMPESLEGTTSPNRAPKVGGQNVMGMIIGGEEVSPDCDLYKEWEATTKSNLELYGCDNWYDWKLANWGTKWGAFEFATVPDKKHTFTFETAWSTPDPIFKMIGVMYPGLSFQIDVHEEADFFSGTINIVNGVVEEDF